jgi:hypothetical protein
MNRFNAFGLAMNFASFTWMIAFMAVEIATGKPFWWSAFFAILTAVIAVWCWRDIEG